MSYRPSFAKLPKPFIVCVLREEHPEQAIATIKNAEYDGAQAYDLHLSNLETRYHNEQALRSIFTSTRHPVLVLNYRNKPGISDEDRIALQLTAIRAGAAGIDMPADTFDPEPAHFSEAVKSTDDHRKMMPKELSMRPDVIARQKELIAQVQEMGAEVLLSSHTRVVMSAEQVVEHALEMQSRGPDMVKIVSICLNEDDLVEAFRAIVELKKIMKVPFQYQCHGEHGKLTRVIGPMLGSMLVFCNQQYTPASLKIQPLVHAMRSVFQNVDWHISTPPEEENFNRS